MIAGSAKCVDRMVMILESSVKRLISSRQILRFERFLSESKTAQKQYFVSLTHLWSSGLADSQNMYRDSGKNLEYKINQENL